MIARLLPMVFILSLLLPTSPRAQTAMTEHKSPSLEVLGHYSLSAASERYSRFIREEIDSQDPPNFSENTKAFIRRYRGEDALQPLTEEDRREREEHLRDHMDDAAVFEVLVTHPDARFDIGGFVQPDPSQPKDYWQVAWNEKFLTVDGERLLEVERGKQLPDATQFRVVFVIHFWKPNLPLRSSYGELSLPPVQPLPERLWQLAPYEVPD